MHDVPLQAPFVFPSLNFERFGIVVQPKGKVVFVRRDRRELPHVTVDWQNRSNVIDVHLTYERRVKTASGADVFEKTHDPLFKIPIATLEALGPKLERTMVRDFVGPLLMAYRKYRVGWLARKNYYLNLQSQDEMEAWFKSLGTKVKGRKNRYHVDHERIVNPEHWPEEWRHFYRADALREIDPKELPIPITLTRIVRGRERPGSALVLSHFDQPGPHGRRGWWGFSARASERLRRRVDRATDDFIRRHATPEHRAAFENIVAGLALDDFPDLAKGIRDFRALLPGK